MTSNPIREWIVLRCIRGCLEMADRWVANCDRIATDMWWTKPDASQANPSRAGVAVGRRIGRRFTRKNSAAEAIIDTARGRASEGKGHA